MTNLLEYTVLNYYHEQFITFPLNKVDNFDELSKFVGSPLHFNEILDSRPSLVLNSRQYKSNKITITLKEWNDDYLTYFDIQDINVDKCPISDSCSITTTDSF